MTYFTIHPRDLEFTLCDSDYAQAVTEIKALAGQFIHVIARLDDIGRPVLFGVRGRNAQSPGKQIKSYPAWSFLRARQNWGEGGCSDPF